MCMQRARRVVVLLGVLAAAMLLAACVIDEDLRINADGSGTYRLRLTIPKELGTGFGELRDGLVREGCVVEDEGTTEQGRFLAVRKDFTDITTLGNESNRFHLTVQKRGLLRRNYHLQVSLEPLTGFKRQFVISMPAKVASADHGDIEGNRVRWDASSGGTIVIAASGYALPLSRNQRLLSLAMLLLAAGGIAVARKRRHATPAALCGACHTQLSPDSRFCLACGTGAPAAQM